MTDKPENARWPAAVGATALPPAVDRATSEAEMDRLRRGRCQRLTR
jgi:hypothetical protein